MSAIEKGLYFDSELETHKCKLCRKCQVCHQCLQVKANVSLKSFSDPDDEIHILCKSLAHNHYKDKRPRYIMVGPNNELQMTTDISRHPSPSVTTINDLENEMQGDESQDSGAESSSTSYDCMVCGKAFETKRDLDIHNIYHSIEEEHKCQVCGKQFDYSYELIKHSINHKNPDNVCQYCKKELPSEESLHLHYRIHTGEKPFVCEVCNKSFKDNWALKSHVLSHTDIRAFPCTKCDKSFRRKRELQSHNRVHVAIKPFMCYVCEKMFRHKCNLKSHLLKTHDVDDD